MANIDALVVSDDGSIRIASIDGSLQSIKALLDGAWLEAVSGELGEWTAYADEEGRLKGQMPNLSAAQIIESLGAPPVMPVGTVVFTGSRYIGGEDGYEEGDIPDMLRSLVTMPH